MKKFVWNLTSTSLTAIVFYAVCGLLLLLLPTQAITIANYVIAGIMAAVGIICIITYFSDSVIVGNFGLRLAGGLALICFSVLMFCYPTFLAKLLPVIWGLSLIVGGFGKIQASADLKRFGDRQWWIILLGAALSFVLGIMCLANPIYIAETILIFIGICLLVEAALDLVSFFVVRHKVKAFQKAVNSQNIEV